MRSIPRPTRPGPYNLKAFLFTSGAIFAGLVANHLFWDLIYLIIS